MPTLIPNVSGLRKGLPGPVFLAPGIYDLGDKPLTLYDGAIVKGSGMGRTVILTRAKGFLQQYGSGISLSDLSIITEGEYGPQDFSIRGHHGNNRNDRCSWERVEFRTNGGRAPWMAPGTDQIVKDCRFLCDALYDGPVNLVGGTNLTFQGNLIEYGYGRVRLTFQTKASIRDNDILLKGDCRGKGKTETGGLEISYGLECTIEDNLILQSEPRNATGDNDGEMLMSQNSNVPDFIDTGRVTSVGTAISTDIRWGKDAWFSANHPATNRKALFVLTGKAAGQWRWVAQGGKDGDVLPESPLELAPGDLVALSSVHAYGHKIRGNTIQGGVRGIQLYNGALDCEISGNTLIDTGIQLRSDSRVSKRTSRPTLQHFPLWGNVVKGNRLVRGTIDYDDHDVTDTRLPLGVLNNVFEDNGQESKLTRFNERGGPLLQNRLMLVP